MMGTIIQCQGGRCSELKFYGYVCVNRHVIWQDNLEVQGPCVNPINEIMNGFLVVVYIKL